MGKGYEVWESSADQLFPNAHRARSYGEPPAQPTAIAPDTADTPDRSPDGEPPTEHAVSVRDGKHGDGEVTGKLAQAAPEAPQIRAPAVAAAVVPGPAAAVTPVPPMPPPMDQVLVGVRVAETAKIASGPGPASPASWGVRGRVNRISGGLVRLRPTPEELRHREQQVRVLRSFTGSQLVMVASPKGGVGKTPTTIGLAASLGFYRGGYVLAWDNNETCGTLGQRAEAGLSAGGSVVDLLGQIDSFLAATAGVGQLGAFVRPQSSRFDVLASDETPGGQQMIGGAGFEKLHQALARWYRLMVVDTGNNVRAPNWWAAVRAANALVVPMTVQVDAANAGLWMLDHLEAVGARMLVKRAVAVVTCADPQVDHQLLARIVETYREIVRDVVVIPFDPRIQPGTRISYQDLAVGTRRAYLAAAVAVIDSLAAAESARRQVQVPQTLAQSRLGRGA
jgi:MinD-like ATPase involved in chromosome partitioning or flagellar assembly